MVVTCFNKEHFLNECITSLIQQTVQPEQIVLIHDGCSEPQSHKEAVTVIVSQNGGVAAARNRAVHLLSTTHLLFIDGDDAIVPDFIERMARSANKADILYPDFVWWYRHSGGSVQNKLNITPPTLTPAAMLKFCRIPVTCLLPRSVFMSLGGFQDYPIFEDYEFWLRAMARGYTFKRVATTLLYRQVKASRNRQDAALKLKTFTSITSRFELRKGVLCERCTPN